MNTGTHRIELTDAAHEADPAPGRGRRARRLVTGAVALVAVAALSGCALLPPPFGTLDLGGASGAGPAAGQQTVAMDWGPCGDEGLVCTEVAAPLDWDDPEGDQITLALIKREAEGTKLGTLFLNPGGPGMSGVDYYMSAHPGATGIAVKEHYDVIAMDTRGSAGSYGAPTAVECLDTAAKDAYNFGVGDVTGARGSAEWLDSTIAHEAAYGEACAERSGALLEYVDTRSTVRDLDMLREMVGDEQLNFLGSDYGTYVGALYADTYPDRVGRMVLDGALDPTVSSFDISLAQAEGMERTLRTYVENCLPQSECPWTGTADDAIASVRALFAQLEATPGVAADGRAVTSESLLNALLLTLPNRYAWMSPGYIFRGAVDGDYANLMEFADIAVERSADGYVSNYSESFRATICLDLVGESDPAKIQEQAALVTAVSPTFGPYLGYGDVDCAGWPVEGASEAPAVSAAGANPILVLSATGDPIYPHAWSESLANQLESGLLLSFEGDSHSIYGTSPCVNTAVNEYFMEGTVPADGVMCTEADDQELRDNGYDGSSQWPLELEGA